MFYDIKVICFYTTFLDLLFVILLTITLTIKINYLPEPYHSLSCGLLPNNGSHSRTLQNCVLSDNFY